MTLRLAVLGAGNAVCSADRDNSYLAVDFGSGILMIDCAGCPVQKLARAGLDPQRVEGVLVTHSHPDHIYGLPALIQHFMESGREVPLTIHGLVESLNVVRQLLAVFKMSPRFLVLHPLQAAERLRVDVNHEFVLWVSPVRHSVPALGVRVEEGESGASMVYSSDTEPCDSLLRLAAGARLLIHECAVNEPTQGHSTPEQVGRVAAQCDVGRLILIHFPEWMCHHRDQIEARVGKFYGGRVGMAVEGEIYEISGA